MLSQLNDDQVEKYHEAFSRQLRRMPQGDRAERQLELRQHLEELIMAYLETDEEPDKAVSLALSKLGDPRRIGRRMHLEWVIAKQEESPQFNASYTFMCFTLMLTAGWMIMLGCLGITTIFNLWQSFDPTACLPLVLGLEIVGSLLFGWMVSRRLGKKAVLATSMMCALALAFMVVLVATDVHAGRPMLLKVLGTGLPLSFCAVATALISSATSAKWRRLSHP
jgi:hypothetical protein